MKRIEKYFGDIFLKVLSISVLHETLPPEEIDHDGIKNILIVVRHQMGDMLCAVPMMRSIRKFYPAAFITLVTKSSTNFREVFRTGSSLADEVKEYEYGFESFVNLVKELRERKYDLAIVPSTVVFSSTNHLIAYYSKAKIRVGVSSIDDMENKASFLLNVKDDFLWNSKKVHQIERNLDVIRQINIQPLEKRIFIQINKECLEFADKFFNRHFPDKSRPVAGFHPGAGKEGNVWPPSKFAELAYLVSSKFNAYILISEGPSDREYVIEMVRILKEKLGHQDYAVHAGFLMNDAALISLTDLFVTNDTGVMHLAAGLETPVVALFGLTQAEVWGPFGDNKFSLQSMGPDINGITVERVYDVCEQILKSKISQKT